MKPKKFRLIAVENSGLGEEVAESNSAHKLINHAIREVKHLAACWDGSVTWFVVETATNQIWFHIGVGRTQSL